MTETTPPNLDKLFSDVTTPVTVQIEERYLVVTDMKEYFIEHLFCDAQTILLSMPLIENIPEVQSVRYHNSKIVVKVEECEDIEITFKNYRIAICFFDECRSTPVETAEKIMEIFQKSINKLLRENAEILINLGDC